MGNAVTADSVPLPWGDLANPPPPGEGTAVDSNVKAWQVQCNGDRVACNPIKLTNPLCLTSNTAYTVLVLRRRGAVGCDPSLHDISTALYEACTPRGLTKPFSLEVDLLPPRTCVSHSVYVWSGRQASGMTKAAALLKGMQLERMLLENAGLGEHLLTAGGPAPITTSITASAPACYSARGWQREREENPPHILLQLSNQLPSPGPSLQPLPQQQQQQQQQQPKDQASEPKAIIPPILQPPSTSPRFTVSREGDEVFLGPPILPQRPFEAWGPPRPFSEDIPDEKAEEQRARDKLLYWSPLCSEVVPHLSVGGHQPAESLEVLLKSGITHILNTAEMIVKCQFPEYFHYLSMGMLDSPNEDIATFFPHAIAHVERVRNQGGKLLIHCQQGASRSCTLVIAYLMWKERRGYQEVLDFVRTKRGIAKPNMGFLTRLMWWEQHLKTVPPVQVYRLQPFTPQYPLPLVFAFQEPPKEGLIDLDPRTIYLFSVYTPSVKRVWLWRGSMCPKGMLQHARSLLPEVLTHCYPTSTPLNLIPSNASSPSMNTPPAKPDPPLVWPAEQLTQPEVIVQEKEPGPVVRHLAGHVNLRNVKPIAENDEIFGDMPKLLEKANSYVKAMAEQETKAADREKMRRSDIMALLTGGRSAVGATPRLRGERLEIRDLFIMVDDSRFEAHPSYGRTPFDDEEFEEFQEQYRGSVCVFLKYRSDYRVLDVWIGEVFPLDDGDDGSKLCSSVVEAFSKWVVTPEGPKWGSDISFNLIDSTGFVVDGLDADKDHNFYGRWVCD